MDYENFNLQIAIAMYLGKKPHQIDWTSDVVIDLATQTILDWNITDVAQPTIEQLTTLWETARLTYYKELQKDKIKAQYLYMLESGTVGCTTTILDSNNVAIVMDARKGDHYSDIQSYEEDLDNLERKGKTTTTVRDFYNVSRTLTKQQLKTIKEDVTDYLIALRTKKWDKDAQIDACTTIATVVAIDFNN